MNGNKKKGVDEKSFSLHDYKHLLKTWVVDKIDEKAINFAEALGRHLVEKRLTTSQIRNIYGEVKRIEEKSKLAAHFGDEQLQDFLLLRPKIAYAAQRAGTRGVDDFKEVMDTMHMAVMTVNEEKRHLAFKRFTNMFEAILAYHKAAGGRE